MKDLLEQVRLGQTHQGSFVITVLTPPIVTPPVEPQQLDLGLSADWGEEDRDAPIQRRMTRRLVEALQATRESTEKRMAGDSEAFAKGVEKGVSANLCDALADLIGPFPTVDIGTSWAQTRPASLPKVVVPFSKTDLPILQEAARQFRHRVPQQRGGVRLHGFVQRLKRTETEDDGTIHLRGHIDGQEQEVTVTTVLAQSDYEKVVQAHRDRAMVTLTGDLERQGQRWRLLNAQVEGVLRNESEEEVTPEGEQSVA